MNKHYRLKFLVFSILSLLIVINARGQRTLNLIPEKSKLFISGTSSIHDWEMEANNFSCEVIVRTDSEITSITKIEFTCPVSGITSNKSIMDKKTYNAMKESSYPEITFLTDENNEILLSGNEAYMNGLLTIAGEAREIQFQSILNVNAEGRLSASGSVPINMTDYNIKPPTAMLGALKTGEEVVVKFNFEFIMKSQEITKNN